MMHIASMEGVTASHKDGVSREINLLVDEAVLVEMI